MSSSKAFRRENGNRQENDGVAAIQLHEQCAVHAVAFVETTNELGRLT